MKCGLFAFTFGGGVDLFILFFLSECPSSRYDISTLIKIDQEPSRVVFLF